MGKIIPVKAPQFPEGGTFDEHAGPGGPKDFPDIVVLSVISFQGLKDPSPAEGIAEHVHETPSRSRVFKMVPFLQVQDLGLNYGSPGQTFKSLHNGIEPIWTDLHIGVQQAKNIRLDMLQTIVIALCKTHVGTVLDQPYIGMVPL